MQLVTFPSYKPLEIVIVWSIIFHFRKKNKNKKKNCKMNEEKVYYKKNARLDSSFWAKLTYT